MILTASQIPMLHERRLLYQVILENAVDIRFGIKLWASQAHNGEENRNVNYLLNGNVVDANNGLIQPISDILSE